MRQPLAEQFLMDTINKPKESSPKDVLVTPSQLKQRLPCNPGTRSLVDTQRERQTCHQRGVCRDGAGRLSLRAEREWRAASSTEEREQSARERNPQRRGGIRQEVTESEECDGEGQD